MDKTLLASLRDITLRYGGRDVLSRVDLDIRRGEIVTVIGPNGAGKSSLLRILLGLVRPDGGRVRRQDHLRIGYMPQNLSLDPTMPLSVGRFLTLTKRVGPPGVLAALEETGVAYLLNSPLQSVSGGELQRILLARALLRDPELLILDEPVQGVDVSGQVELYRLIGRIRERYGCGILMVSHDLHLVMAATDQVICLNHHVCCAGHPEAVSRHPAYLALFPGTDLRGMAVYTHHHDHCHTPHGDVVPTAEGACDAG